MSCPFVLRYRSMDGPEHPPFDTSGRTVLNATWYKPNRMAGCIIGVSLREKAKPITIKG